MIKISQHMFKKIKLDIKNCKIDNFEKINISIRLRIELKIQVISLARSLATQFLLET